MKKQLSFCVILLCLACNVKEEKKVEDKMYFDLDGYFKKEATRLTKTNPTVFKTVVVNGKTEEKNLKLQNWKQEFSSFIDADINKASWRGSFTVSKTDSLITYISENKKIPISKVEVRFLHQSIASVKIFINNKNYLYTSSDSLIYYPDSLYRIKKTQNIKLIDAKNYQVTGKFK